jgi:two-component system OmpR family response regulator
MAESRRILVIDDDPDIRTVLARYFGDAGHEVRTAPDGRQGLDEVRAWSPDIVLLDLEMPAMNGLDVLRHIGADHAGVPVVAFSGHAVAEQLGSDARRLGAREFLVKPFGLEQLAQVVDDALADS